MKTLCLLLFIILSDENGGEYARETYMNHVGDLNNMIIMYPQVGQIDLIITS